MNTMNMYIQKLSYSKTIASALGGGLFLLLLTAYSLYVPGLSGVFIFDDVSNLSPLGQHIGLSLLDNFWLYLLEGFSGPTGRPVSLASFYLNDIHWPSSPKGFIQTNILIPLLNGVLIFWLLHKLSSYLQLSNKKQLFFILLTTTFWLLHPMHTTSVLYIIQRMTELSATFVITGLIFYLYGREKLLTKSINGLITLFMGVGTSLILAILSKENGILLVAYILVIEYFLIRPLGYKSPKLLNYWLIPAVFIPFTATLIYLGYRTDPDSFIARDFTLGERLFTQPRILFDYIYQIVLPKMNNLTLYHDGYIVSKSWLTPWTTLPAILGVIILLTLMIYLRKKTPLIAFAIAWFFSGHLLESTVLPLELYFEHRNYLPMLGIFIALVFYTIKLFKQQKGPIGLIMVSLIMFNAFVLFQNTTLWGKPIELSITWHQNHPRSIRSTQQFNYIMKKTGLDPNNFQDKKYSPPSNKMLEASTAMNSLALTCESGEANIETLEDTLRLFEKNIVHISSAISLARFVNSWFNKECEDINVNELESFLLSLSSIEQGQNIKVFSRAIHSSLSRVYVLKKDLDKTIFHLDKAYKIIPTLDPLLVSATYLTTAGLYDEALEVLNDTHELKNGFRKKLILKIRMKELRRLKDKIIAIKNKKN